MLNRVVLVAVGLMLLTFTVAANAQGLVPEVKVTIDHSFVVNGKTLPAGYYTLTYDDAAGSFAVSGRGLKDADALATVQTRLSGPNENIKLTEARLIFDVVGGKYILSEIWVPNQEGFLVGSEKLAHTHSVTKARRS